PSSPVACSANDRTWQEALDGVLEPLGLTWWAIDGQTIQITSIAGLEKIERLEFYELPAKLRGEFADNQAIVNAIQKVSVSAPGEQHLATAARIQVDGPSGRLLVLASPAVHRELSRKFSAAK